MIDELALQNKHMSPVAEHKKQEAYVPYFVGV